jgi:hypothetical protein
MKILRSWVAVAAATAASLGMAVSTALAAPVSTTYQLSLPGSPTYYSPITIVEPFGGINNDQAFGNFPGAPPCPTNGLTDTVTISGVGGNELLQYVVDVAFVVPPTTANPTGRIELPGFPQPVVNVAGAGGTVSPNVGTGNATVTINIPSSTTWQSPELRVQVNMQVFDSTTNPNALLRPSPFPMAAAWDIFSSGCATPPPPPPNTTLGKGMTATIGFWHNKNGQALINSFNGGSNSTALANYLATTYPKLYGCLANKSNADIAALFLTDFSVQGAKVDAQVLAVALATYATNSTLAGGTQATQFGFQVSSTGVTLNALFNVGNDGAAVGVPNNTVETVSQILQGANSLSANCVLDQTNLSLLNQTNDLFDAINSTGDIG